MTNQWDYKAREIAVTQYENAMRRLVSRAHAPADMLEVALSIVRTAFAAGQAAAQAWRPSLAEADIAAERQRQIDGEGWTIQHDDEHKDGSLALAAAAYAGHVGLCTRTHSVHAPRAPLIWPWDRQWWKPKSPRRDLVRAAALIVAEIERLDRGAQPLPLPPEPQG